MRSFHGSLVLCLLLVGPLMGCGRTTVTFTELPQEAAAEPFFADPFSITDEEVARFKELAMKGRAALDQGNFQDAHTAFTELGKLFPLNPAPLVYLARMQESKGNRMEAQLLLDHAIALGYTDVKALEQHFPPETLGGEDNPQSLLAAAYRMRHEQYKRNIAAFRHVDPATLMPITDRATLDRAITDYQAAQERIATVRHGIGYQLSQQEKWRRAGHSEGNAVVQDSVPGQCVHPRGSLSARRRRHEVMHLP